MNPIDKTAPLQTECIVPARSRAFGNSWLTGRPRK